MYFCLSNHTELRRYRFVAEWVTVRSNMNLSLLPRSSKVYGTKERKTKNSLSPQSDPLQGGKLHLSISP